MSIETGLFLGNMMNQLVVGEHLTAFQHVKAAAVSATALVPFRT